MCWFPRPVINSINNLHLALKHDLRSSELETRLHKRRILQLAGIQHQNLTQTPAIQLQWCVRASMSEHAAAIIWCWALVISFLCVCVCLWERDSVKWIAKIRFRVWREFRAQIKGSVSRMRFTWRWWHGQCDGGAKLGRSVIWRFDVYVIRLSVD